MKIALTPLLFIMAFQSSSFRDQQQQHPRVKAAYDQREDIVRGYFSEKNISYGRFELFIRGFKSEKLLEVWVKEKGTRTFSLLHTYDFCATSGVPGPKRREGDLQIPEGFYKINHFNPRSTYHLSLGIDYPNQSDRILGDPQRPGSAIYIHGNCVTVGCIPINDEKIQELYIIATEARNAGQEEIQVHIFPTKLSDQKFSALTTGVSDKKLIDFWSQLQIVYKDFERTHQLSPVKISATGDYSL